ncbi:PCMD domain-containing protein [Sphingobacterium sp. SYP-B4668]|uniref:PCMD domain-containing protein n=1 Tax=Sphingobacterium sp. SYP-B4668 TaxID=2996035 RepID=UPI0022DD89E0|nr:PCMD domain-containing protein [Sphingobacterium sp. SYP-B4668]
MKQKITILFTLLAMLVLSGCIKDEPLNMEADIVSVNIEEGTFLTDPLITNSTVFIYVKPGLYDLKKYKLDIEVTPGATITPLSGSEQDFSGKVEYTVTSEDGQFQKKYKVSIIETSDSSVPTFFDFESFEIDADDKYTSFYDLINGHQVGNWSSGNLGFSLTLSIDPSATKAPEAYPTLFTTDKRSGEYAVLMETKLTGAFGAAFKKPIAAGNLFLGSFDTAPLLSDPLKATRFGLPFNKVPVALEGYYKYAAGAQVTDENLKPVNMPDSCDIYAVFYNREELIASTKKSYLDGTNVLTHPSVVAIARLENGSPTKEGEFVKFTIPFNYIKEFNEEAVSNLGYNIAIVMSSSKYGDSFKGAVGSKLIVDDLKIITK